ncbi:MAG: hypothetical protein ACOC0P_06290 [Planctomycetota bacterium]
MTLVSGLPAIHADELNSSSSMSPDVSLASRLSPVRQDQIVMHRHRRQSVINRFVGDLAYRQALRRRGVTRLQMPNPFRSPASDGFAVRDVNIAHASDAMAVAVRDCHQFAHPRSAQSRSRIRRCLPGIGVDLVRLSPALAEPGVFEQIATEDEQRMLVALPRESSLRTSTVQQPAEDGDLSMAALLHAHLIARREAVGKLIGWGLSRGPDALPIALEACLKRSDPDAQRGRDRIDRIDWSCWRRVVLPDGSGAAVIASCRVNESFIAALAIRLPSALQVCWQTRCVTDAARRGARLRGQK